MKNKIKLKQTCIAYPEQYEAFVGEKQVGYLRLRHGYFRVDFPDCGGKTIYKAHPKGEGMFKDNDERKYYLKMAKKVILKELNKKEQKNFDKEMKDMKCQFCQTHLKECKECRIKFLESIGIFPNDN